MLVLFLDLLTIIHQGTVQIKNHKGIMTLVIFSTLYWHILALLINETLRTQPGSLFLERTSCQSDDKIFLEKREQDKDRNNSDK